MNDASVSPATDTPPAAGVPQKNFLLLVAFAVATHIALVVLFGAKKQITPKPVTNVPVLQLGDAEDELLALDNPALFARPNPRDFSASEWQRPLVITQPSFRHAEAPRYLAQPPDLGAVFSGFMRTNRFENYRPDFKPAAPFAEAVFTPPAQAHATTMNISGALTGRKLLSAPALPALEFNDTLAASTVQVLVDRTGNVTSATLANPAGLLADAARASLGDQTGLTLAKQFRFAPASKITLGEITFVWHTIPSATTNQP
jgi:hypothetical protein